MMYNHHQQILVWCKVRKVCQLDRDLPCTNITFVFILNIIIILIMISIITINIFVVIIAMVNHDLDDHPNNWDMCDMLSQSLQSDVQLHHDHWILKNLQNAMQYACSGMVCSSVRGFLYNHCMAWYLQYAGKYAWPSPDIWNITAAGIAVAILQ